MTNDHKQVPNDPTDSNRGVEKPSARILRRLGRLCGGLFGLDRNNTQEHVRRYSFLVLVEGKNKIADAEVSREDLMIDEGLIKPVVGELVIITRPSTDGEEATSHVFQTREDEAGELHWGCVAVKGGVARKIDDPTTPYKWAKDDDRTDISLPKGTEVVRVRDVQSSEDVLEIGIKTIGDESSLSMQDKYQRIISIAMGTSLGAEQSNVITDRIAGIDALIAQIDARQKEIAQLVGRGDLGETRGKGDYDLIDAERQRLLAERARLTDE